MMESFISIPQDTHKAVELLQAEGIRKMSLAERFLRTCNLSNWAFRMTKNNIRKFDPDLSDSRVALRFIELQYGKDLSKKLEAYAERLELNAYSINEIVEALTPIVRTLEALSVDYFIGGSIGSSVHGIARTTQDIDMVTNLKATHVEHLVKTLENLYYIDKDMILRSLEEKTSFNLIHLQTQVKIDVFFLKSREFDQGSLKRISKESLIPGGSAEFYVTSAEDIILNKLEWFLSGNRASERQWKDIIGVLQIQKNNLDWIYLTKWATTMGTLPELEQARTESGTDFTSP